MKGKALFTTVLMVTALSAQAYAQKTTLNFWSWRVEDKAFYEQVAADFEKSTGIAVRYNAYKNEEYPAVLASALAAGSGPDIIHTRAYGGLTTLSDAGYLLPVSKAEVPNIGSFSPALLNAARGKAAPYNQNIYGVPFATQTLGIMYNNTVLKKAGITALPKTWGEFKTMLATLKAKNIIPMANGTKEAPTIEQLFGVVGPMFYGGDSFFTAVMTGKKTFDDPGFINALNETAALTKFFPPNYTGIGENESRLLFATDQAAFLLTGTWNIDSVKTLNPKLDMGMMAAPPRSAGGPQYVSTFADGNYSINAKTKSRAAAIQFLNYLASKEYGQRFTDELRQVSAVPGTVSKDPILATMSSLARKDGTPFIMLVGFRYDNPNGSVLLREGLQKMTQGQTTAKQLAQDITRSLATWHTPFKK